VPDAASALAGRWLRRARSDARIGRRLLADRAPDDAWAACFHAQQAGEKAVKAFLVARGIDFPKTHDLARLSGLVPAGPAIPTSRRDLEWLTYFATAGRYFLEDPIGSAEPGWDDAERALEIAGQLLHWVERDATARGWTESG